MKELRRDIRSGRIGRRLLVVLVVLGMAVAALCLIQVDYVVEAPFEVAPADRAVIRAPIDGYVARVTVHEGQPVKRGEVLAEVVNEELRKKRDVLVERKKIYSHRKQQALVDDPAAYMVFEAAESAVQKEIDLIDKKCEEGILRAPFDGIICHVKLSEVGERKFGHPQVDAYIGEHSARIEEFQDTLVRNGVGIMAVARTDAMLFKTYVHQRDLNYVDFGRPITATFLSWPNRTVSFEVGEIAATNAKQLDNPGVTQEGTGSIPTQRSQRRRLFESQVPLVHLFVVQSVLDECDLPVKWGMTGKAHIYYGRGPVGVFWLSRAYRFLRERAGRII